MPELTRESQDLTEMHVPKERRHVFTDYTPPSAARSNRPFRRQRISTFAILLSLTLLAIVSVLYVSNIIAVNRLVVEIETMKGNYSKIQNMNEILRSEISHKSSMERVTKIASEQIGLIFPKEPPIWFELEAGTGKESRER